jgi:hypothetical protein
MAAMTVHPVFAAKPPPFRQDNSSGSFVDHFNSSKMFLGQYSNGSNIFFKLAETLHLQNVASHKTLQSMDISIVNSLTTQMLNRLEKVAAIVHANNAWASTSTYRVFPRTSAVPEQDKVLTDLAELKHDITRIPTAPTPSPPPSLWGFKTFKSKSAFPKSKITLFTGFLTLYRCRAHKISHKPQCTIALRDSWCHRHS